MRNSRGFLSVSEGLRRANNNRSDFYIRSDIRNHYIICCKMYFAEFGVSNGLQSLCLASISSEKLIGAMIVAGVFGIPFAGIALYFRPKYKKA